MTIVERERKKKEREEELQRKEKLKNLKKAEKAKKLLNKQGTCPEMGCQLIKLIDLFDPHGMKNLYGEV